MGCTALGNVVNGDFLVAAKNMDLTVHYEFTNINTTSMEDQHGKVLWLSRPKREGTTLGANTSGLFLAGLDLHVTYETEGSREDSNNIGSAYLWALESAATVDQATDSLQESFGGSSIEVPDMILLAGRNLSGDLECRALEFDPRTPENWYIESSKALIRTNIGLVTEENQPRGDADPDSHIRLERAEELLPKVTGARSMIELLKDHQSGLSQNSICRHADPDGPTASNFNEKGTYNTVASAIMTYDPTTDRLTFYHLLGKNPCEGEYTEIVIQPTPQQSPTV
jgi:hypothetical protein